MRGRLEMQDYQAYLDEIGSRILSPSVKGGFDHWRSLLRGKRFPKRREIDPTAIPNQLLRVTLIEVQLNPLRFTTRLAGEYVRLHQGIGAGTQIVAGGHPGQSHDRVYRRCKLCVEQRRPIRGLYQFSPLDRPHVRMWVEALACPLSDDGETIDCMVCFGADHDFKVPADAKEWP